MFVRSCIIIKNGGYKCQLVETLPQMLGDSGAVNATNI